MCTFATVRSKIRGTEWFNDATTMIVPVIIANIDAKKLFEQAFPDHPFVGVSLCQDKKSIYDQLLAAATFNSKQYIFEHNKKLRERLYS